jgi:hypothetical protein
VNGLSTHFGARATCVVRAAGVVEVTAEGLSALRQQPGPQDGLPVPASLLNHAEDQSVVALAAVLRAIDEGRLHGQSFADWAVVASPRFAGRVGVAAAVERFHQLGPLSVSPLIIPFMSLHAVSSMISLALHIQGPSVGVGGGNGEFGQALMTGLALLHDDYLPGVWAVVSGWDPEMVPEPDAAAVPPPVCRAAALALVPDAAGAAGACLRLAPRTDVDARGTTAPGLPDLVRFLAGMPAGQLGSWRFPISGGFDLELTVTAATVPLARSA